MVQIIPTEQEALDLANMVLRESGRAEKAVYANEIDRAKGISHYNFNISTDKRCLILRILPSGEHPVPGRGDDNYFGGPLTIEREIATMMLVREAGVPAPKVIGFADKGEQGKVMLVEKMPGELFRDYLDHNAHSFSCFLQGMSSLGKAMGRIHGKTYSVPLDNFGKLDLEGNKPVIMSGTEKYGDYLETIIGRHFKGDLEIFQHYFNSADLKEIDDYFKKSTLYANTELAERKLKPSLVVYDIHSRNFFVDPDGLVSGFYDLEYGQAAHPNLEIGGIALTLFGFYHGEYSRQKAREAFMEGYIENNGPADINEPRLEVIHTANHLFSAVKSYHGKKDGLRDDWSEKLSRMVLGIVRADEVNCHDTFTDMTRPVTRQPERPDFNR
ncbi:aminoglycoside phosphotransferase family protein [Candidatus Woesearchaeota archaeon]|nr:aminoglycoside phosphotransferase family protein [Candidatus Woesearchaeota archaeon]